MNSIEQNNNLVGSPESIKVIKQFQRNEDLGSLIYEFMSKREKDNNNKRVLEKMSEDERNHANIWRTYTKEDIRAKKGSLLFLKFLTIVLGYTFIIKKLEKDENLAQRKYEELKDEFPEIAEIIKDEDCHEKELHVMLDEERLSYIGSMVLGLNDALVELTGAIAGVTFALCNTRLIAMTGIVTGVSATLSMASSNYLAERANKNKNAMKSSIYTGIAYLITVVLLVLPYIILPTKMYLLAFSIMLLVVVFIIMFFNYYISVVREEKFIKKFLEMIVISFSVAGISFVISIIAKKILGIDTL